MPPASTGCIGDRVAICFEAKTTSPPLRRRNQAETLTPPLISFPPQTCGNIRLPKIEPFLPRKSKARCIPAPKARPQVLRPTIPSASLSSFGASCPSLQDTHSSYAIFTPDSTGLARDNCRGGRARFPIAARRGFPPSTGFFGAARHSSAGATRRRPSTAAPPRLNLARRRRKTNLPGYNSMRLSRGYALVCRAGYCLRGKLFKAGGSTWWGAGGNAVALAERSSASICQCFSELRRN